MGNVQFTGNEKAVAQAKAQALEHAFSEAKCPECGTSPRLRQFGRCSCECGKLRGVVELKR